MYHRVTHQLALDTGPLLSTVTDFSRAITVGEDNRAMFEFWTVSKGGTIDSLVVVLQGSNDASTWNDIATETVGTVVAPSYRKKIVADAIPWVLLRLKYTSNSTAKKPIMVRGAIETLKSKA